MTEERTTPHGMWRYGNDFRQAAISALLHHHSDHPFIPYYFLLGQSIELSLKAFLMLRGKSIVDLRKKYGHSLKDLLDDARCLGLETEVKLAKAHCAAIHLLGIEYMDKRLQYIKTGRIVLPYVWLAQEAADLLSDGLKECCAERVANCS